MRLFQLLLAVLLLAPTAPAQTEQPAPAPFDMLVDAIADDGPRSDWWYKVPTNMPPTLFKIDQVVVGQEFSIIPVFSGYAKGADGRAKVTYDLKRLLESGEQYTAAESIQAIDMSIEDPGLYLLATRTMTVRADQDTPLGLHTFILTATDQVSGSSVTKQVSVRILAWDPDQNADLSADMGTWVTNYYKRIRPDEAFARFWIQADQMGPDGKPLIMRWFELAFFAAAFEDCPVAMDALEKRFPDAKPHQQLQLCLLFAYMDAGPRLDNLAKLNPEAVDWARKQTIPKPYGPITGPQQLDMLWSEFLATGRYAPVLAIVNALGLEPAESDQAQQAPGEDPEEVKRLALLELTSQSAAWSLGSNAEQHERVRQYLHFAAQQADLKDSTRAALKRILKIPAPK